MVLTILFLGFLMEVNTSPQYFFGGSTATWPLQPILCILFCHGETANFHRKNMVFPNKIDATPKKRSPAKWYKMILEINPWARDSNGNQSHEISSAEQQVVSCSLCWFGAKQASPLSASQWQLKLFKDAINSLSLHSSLGTTSTEEHNILPNEFWSTHVKQFQDLAAWGKTEFQTIVDTGLSVLGCAPGVLWHVSSVMVHLVAGSHRKNVGQQSIMNPAK